MRVAVAVVLIASCRSEPETGAFDPAEAVRETTGSIRVEVDRRKVPLEQMPIAAQVLRGLPMSGLADIEIDLEVPKQGGMPKYGKARGSIAFRCPTGCAIGDGKAKLALPELPGIDFGRLGFDRLEARVEVADGKVDITTWELRSADLVLEARLHIDLADRLEDSKLDGCVRFLPTQVLLLREPKTHAALSLTGASLDREGLYTIQIDGTIGERKYLARECTTSR